MPKGSPKAQTIASKKYQEKVGYITKGFKMKREVAEEFVETCKRLELSQASVIVGFMKDFCKKNAARKNRVAYPVFIKQDDDYYLVYVPDLAIFTEGYDFADAIYMARDAMEMRLEDYYDAGEKMPEPSTSEMALKKAKEAADDIFDYSDGILTFVDVVITTK